MIVKYRLLALLLLVGFSMAATTPKTTHATSCPECLTATMRQGLQLTQRQESVVLAINASFLRRREQLVSRPPAIGRQTALLACWSDWRAMLMSVLAPTQMDLFDAWQSGYDLVGNDFQ